MEGQGFKWNGAGLSKGIFGKMRMLKGREVKEEVEGL